MNRNITKLIVDTVKELREEDYPDKVYSFAKDCILDYLGVTFAGEFELHDKYEKYLNAIPDEERIASVIGHNKKCSIYTAALLNGISAHYFELDDGNRFGMVHLGAPIISALFPVAQAYSISAGQFLKGLIIGYEIAIRLAIAIQPAHKLKGFHATGTCGCIGASIAVAVALESDDTCLENVLATASASSSGLLEMIEDKSQLKPFNAGKAAQNGLIAYFLGHAGFVGPEDPIGGKRGLLGTMGETFNQESFDRHGENKFKILSIYRKPYASCRHCHPAVEAALKIRDVYEIKISDIDTIEVQTYGLAVHGHDHRIIRGLEDAKMSIPYTVAAGLILKDGGLNSLSETSIKNKNILELAKKVNVIENQKYSTYVPKKRVSKLILHMANGEEFSYKVEFPKGEPENPLSKREIIQKFKNMMEYSNRNEHLYKIITTSLENMNICFEELLKCL